MWWLYLIVFILGLFIGTIFVIARCPIMGTIYLDLNSRDDKDIARITFERSFEEIQKHGLAMIKVEKRNNLSSFDQLR